MIYVVIDTNFFVARIYIISEIRKEILYMQRYYMLFCCVRTQKLLNIYQESRILLTVNGIKRFKIPKYIWSVQFFFLTLQPIINR